MGTHTNAKMKESRGAKLRRIYALFMLEREQRGEAHKPVALNDVYDFARQYGWSPPSFDVRARFRKELAVALRDDHFIDKRGRTVRRYHAAKSVHIDEFGVAVQEVLWADILSDPPPPRSHMEVAFKQRREQIVQDCFHLKNDVGYWNEKMPDSGPDGPILMLWDFTYDLADLEQPTEYNPQDDQKME